jgi:hypothetical protein
MVTLRHCRHRRDGRGTNFPPRWRDPPTTDRTVDARNHELRCRVSSRRHGRWNWGLTHGTRSKELSTFRAAEATSRARLDRGVLLCCACQCFRVARQEAVTPRRARPHPQAGQAGRFSGRVLVCVACLAVIRALKPAVDLSRRARTQLFGRNVLIRGRS